MNKIFIFFLIFFSVGSTFAQNGYDEPVVEEYVDTLNTGHYRNMLRADSVLLKNPVTENSTYPKKFKENFNSKYKDKEFDYSTSKPRESFMQKLQRKIAKIMQTIFGTSVFNTSSDIAWLVVRLLGIFLVGFLLYFIIKYLINQNGGFFFSKKNKKVSIREQELHENIHEINFPESIAQFENSGDYRSAVRYQFLFILKKLSDKKIISWNPEKTNKDYIIELKTAHLKTGFSDLSYIFDYVWYGEFRIDQASYLKFKNQFQSFQP